MYEVLSDEMYEDMRVVVARMRMGHLCGYVGVPIYHPLFRKAYYNRIGAKLDKSQPIGDRGPISLLLMAIDREERPRVEYLFDVHGSLTYSTERLVTGFASTFTDYPVEAANTWFFGFDCNHYEDTPFEWNFKRVREETIHLADQLIAFSRL